MEETPKKEYQSPLRGLYKHVNISVKTLDKIIVLGIVVIAILLIFGISNNGFTVNFDSNGGTDVQPLTKVMYGELLTEPEPPTREGYVFTGWYSDENLIYQWDFDTMEVSQGMTLYAGWKAK